MNHQYARKPAQQQVWAIGEQVKVGFLSLRVVGKALDGSWKLVNKDASRHYEFTPHLGIIRVFA